MPQKQESKLVNNAVELRQFLTNSRFGLTEIMRIYTKTPISDYFIHDERKGEIQHKRKLQKKNFWG